jgi:hypothetical protein
MLGFCIATRVEYSRLRQAQALGGR